MITEGEAAILLVETTRRALGNQSQSKQRSTLAAPSARRIIEIHFPRIIKWKKKFA